jgi:hypothetical protein
VIHFNAQLRSVLHLFTPHCSYRDDVEYFAPDGGVASMQSWVARCSAAGVVAWCSKAAQLQHALRGTDTIMREPAEEFEDPEHMQRPIVVDRKR